MGTRRFGRKRKESGQPLARGVSLFFGCFALLNLLGAVLGHGANQNIWWVDFSFLYGWFGPMGTAAGLVVQLLAGVLLVVWAVFPEPGRLRKALTLALLAALALVALQNAVAFWQLLASGALFSAFPVPLSLLMAACFALLFRAVLHRGAESARREGVRVGVGVVAWACVALLVFPLLQIAFFGTTDYRRDADAIVVLGAQVYPDGRLSLTLSERMDKAIELYGQQLAPKLVVSGGTGVEGVNEAEAMAAYAERRGVPADAIIVDAEGVSTEATVVNTLAIAREQGLDELLVTSSFYHMPRTKMCYLAAGHDVRTVPMVGDVLRDRSVPITLREVFAWWVYWLRSAVF